MDPRVISAISVIKNSWDSWDRESLARVLMDPVEVPRRRPLSASCWEAGAPWDQYKKRALSLLLYSAVPHIALKLHSPHLSRIQLQYPLLIMANAKVEYKNITFRHLINNDNGSRYYYSNLVTWRPDRKSF